MKRISGYTLAEIMITSSIAIIVLAILITALVMSERMWRWEVKESTLQRDAQVAAERIARAIRPARAVYVENNGDAVRFVTDINLTPFLYTDDVTGRFQINANGKTTTEGEAMYDLVFDPDVTTAGDEEVLNEALVKDASTQLFLKSGGLLSVNYSLKDDYARDGFQSTDISYRVRNRNY